MVNWYMPVSYTHLDVYKRQRFGKINELAEKLNAPIISADATSMEDLTKLFQGSVDALGGKIDFVLHSIGMSINVRKGKHYTDLNHEWMMKTMDISALSFHRMMQVALKNDCIADWGSVLGLTSVSYTHLDVYKRQAMLSSNPPSAAAVKNAKELIEIDQ